MGPAPSVQICSLTEEESPKKGWFIPSGLCDPVAVKGVFKSSALILDTNVCVSRIIWKEHARGRPER